MLFELGNIAEAKPASWTPSYYDSYRARFAAEAIISGSIERTEKSVLLCRLDQFG